MPSTVMKSLTSAKLLGQPRLCHGASLRGTGSSRSCNETGVCWVGTTCARQPGVCGLREPGPAVRKTSCRRL
eukprot:6106293-Alexandrium_andersonii.AAC.1